MNPRFVLAAKYFSAALIAIGVLWLGRWVGFHRSEKAPTYAITAASEQQTAMMLARYPEASDKPMLIEAMDFECPPCRHTHSEVSHWLAQHRGVAFHAIHFPLPFHPLAMPCAIAAEVARKQGRFDQAYSYFYTHELPKGEQAVNDALVRIGVKPSTSITWMDARRAVDSDREFARRFGVQGTPTLIAWNGRRLYLIASPNALDVVFSPQGEGS